jgi:NAD(P)-dependent dehydrogenase (short-subunit alcohol dehydrogenase family)
MQQMAASIPVRRLGQPDDVARAVMFMLAPGNGFVTGQTLMVCGGASLGSLSL